MKDNSQKNINIDISQLENLNLKTSNNIIQDTFTKSFSEKEQNKFLSLNQDLEELKELEQKQLSLKTNLDIEQIIEKRSRKKDSFLDDYNKSFKIHMILLTSIFLVLIGVFIVYLFGQYKLAEQKVCEKKFLKGDLLTIESKCILWYDKFDKRGLEFGSQKNDEEKTLKQKQLENLSR